jgi:predicted metalloprotease with PDZ domain
VRRLSPMKLLCFFALCVAATAAASAQSNAKLAYWFAPDLKGPVPVLHVALSFEGNSAGSSILVLPTTWAGQVDLFQSVVKLRAIDSSEAVTATDHRGMVQVRYPPNRTVRIAYDLVSDWTGSLRHPKEFRPLVQSSHVIFNGQNGLVSPKLAQNAAVRATFSWTNLPKGWSVASSFGIRTNHQKFDGEWHEIHDALFAAGDFRFTRVQSSGQRLVLAARGSWVFPDRQAAQEIVSLFRVEREFWREHKPNSFLVVLTPYDQDLGGSDGTAFTNSFLLYLSRKQTFLTDEKSQLAHEIFHTWNPYRMGIAAGDDTQWFTEGFTRYYQDRMLLRAQLIDYPQYLERLNRIIAAYWSSPDRNWTQAQWLDRKQAHHAAEYEGPYRRGAVIALWVDQRIREQSGGHSSLNERMLSLVRSKPDVELTTDYLLSVLSKSMSSEDAAALHGFVLDGATIPLPAQLADNCGRLAQPVGSNPYYIPSAGQCDDQFASDLSK